MFGLISGIIGLFIFVVAGLFGVLCFVFWIWMLIHAITNKGLGGGEKIAWVLVIFFLHALGGLIYFFIGRPKALA